MSTHQHTKPRCATQSMTDESGRPGTLRSNVGCEAIDEPCTNRTAGLPAGESTYFSQRKRRTSPSDVDLRVQCSTPVTRASEGVVRSFMLCSRGRGNDGRDVRDQSTFAPVSRMTL